MKERWTDYTDIEIDYPSESVPEMNGTCPAIPVPIQQQSLLEDPVYCCNILDPFPILY